MSTLPTRALSLPRTLAAGAGLALLLLAVAAVATARPVHAVSSITVNTLADGKQDAGNTTTCTSAAAAGKCTLRAAIELNDANGGGAAITLGIPGQVALKLGQLVITKNVTITGSGPGSSSVKGDGASRVFAMPSPTAQVALSGFTVLGGTAAGNFGGGIINLGGLTLANVVVQGNTAASGGGITDAGTLTLQPGTVVSGNVVHAANGVPGLGGGIAEFGKLVATGAVLTSNTADEAGGNLAVSTVDVNGQFVAHGTASVAQTTISQGTAPFGGGVLVDVGESATFTASTFAGNAAAPGALGGDGGAIENGCGALTLTNDTLAGNHADGFGGAIDQVCENLDAAKTAAPAGRWSARRQVPPAVQLPQTGVADVSVSPSPNPTPTPVALAATGALDFVTMADNTGDINQGQSLGSTIANAGELSTITAHDTIVAKKSGDPGKDCRLDAGAKLTSQGYNLESANDCGFTSTGDQTGIDPKLGALASNGGSTQTMALTAGTPAVDTADPKCDVNTDQRGISRPQGPRCDIGAFELQVATPASPTPLPAPPVTGQGPAGADLSLIALILALLALPAVGIGLVIARRRTA